MEKNGATVKNRSVNFNKLKINKYMSAKVFIFMIIGFLLSRFTLVDNVAPFGIAFFLCFVKLDKYKLPVFITTLLGILLSFNTFVNMTKYSIALVVVLLLSKKLKNVDSVAKISIIGKNNKKMKVNTDEMGRIIEVNQDDGGNTGTNKQ